MRNHERRRIHAYPYYKVATWDPISLTFRDGKTAFPSSRLAYASISGPGRFRLSEVTADGRVDMEPFDVGEMVGGD